jgi:hypothetical protein
LFASVAGQWRGSDFRAKPLWRQQNRLAGMR